MDDSGEGLRSASDALLRDLDVLATLEETKRTLDPGDRRVVDLAAQIRDIAARVLDTTQRQEALTRVIQAQVESGAPGAPTATINETPRSVAAILAEWRAAERRRAGAPPGSAEAAEATALVDRLRDEYRRASDAVSAARGGDQPR